MYSWENEIYVLRIYLCLSIMEVVFCPIKEQKETVELFNFQVFVNVKLYYCGHGCFCFWLKFCIDKLVVFQKKDLRVNRCWPCVNMSLCI